MYWHERLGWTATECPENEENVEYGARMSPEGIKNGVNYRLWASFTSPQGEELWTFYTFIGTIAYGIMSNAGNFAVEDSSLNKL